MSDICLIIGRSRHFSILGLAFVIQPIFHANIDISLFASILAVFNDRSWKLLNAFARLTIDGATVGAGNVEPFIFISNVGYFSSSAVARKLVSTGTLPSQESILRQRSLEKS